MRRILGLMILLTFTFIPVSFADDNLIPPAVVSSSPVSGSVDVSSDLETIKVTFSADMDTNAVSWCYEKKEDFPELAGKQYEWFDARTCVLHVKLEQNKQYVVWVNLGKYQNFRGVNGRPCPDYPIVFKTGE